MSQLDLLNPQRTLSDAKADVEASIEYGIECPCCGQLARMYRRKLNSAMARSLIWLVREWEDPHNTTGWVDVSGKAPAWLLRSRELPKLAYWGLIEQKGNDDDTKRTSGIWRPTQAGSMFAKDQARVPSHVLIYNGTVYGFSNTLTTIRESLGKKFDYSELMGWR